MPKPKKPVIHSRCVQRECNSVHDAITLFSQKDEYGNMPLVLIPERRSTCALLMSVPDGVFCLMQKWGQAMPPAEPGLNIKPGWWRIAYIVTKQSNTYDAPVRACPTKDNVHVDIDVVIVFNIVDPNKFVYDLGASNFDEFLRGTVDEAIRKLVRKQDIYTVYGLRGDRADEELRLLNLKFKNFGVNFSDMKVTAVWLPGDLQDCLEQTTMSDFSMQKLRRQHEYEILKIEQENDLAIENIKRRTEQALVGEAGRKKRAEIDFEQKSVKAEEEGMIQRIQAEQEAEVMEMEKQTELNRKKTELETFQVREMARALTLAAEKKIRAEVEAEMNSRRGSWLEEAMVCEAQATKHEAVAEAEASLCLIQKRKHELELREKTILQKLAAKGNFNLIGTPADKLISAMLTGSFGSSN